MTTYDQGKQIKYIQTLYVDKASQGLKDFMSARNYTPDMWAREFKKYPKFWKSVRPKTLQVISKKNEINKVMQKFRQLYPPFKQPEIYFTIGGLRSGGTTSNGKILVGTELAAADSNVDGSELNGLLKKEDPGIIQLIAHESVHTQQTDDSENLFLLSKCLREGSCDFIAELLIGALYTSPYLSYGRAHEQEIFERFKKDMYTTNASNWLYNSGSAPTGQGDLGYFMGYVICKYYYSNAKDKTKALADIISIDYTGNEASQKFYEKTGYATKIK